MLQRQVGEVIINRVIESERPDFDAAGFFPKVTPEQWAPYRQRLAGWAMDTSANNLVFPMQSFLLRTRYHTIVVDTCVGDHKERARPNWNMTSSGEYLKRFAETGVRPEQVDFVMTTHFHTDHVGWNTRWENGRWVPTFPNAKYLFARREYAHWETEHRTQGKETNGGSFDDSVLPIVEAGKAVVIDSDHQPDPLLTIKDYPGHTPGSIAINLRDGGKQACFSGDIMHHPIQVYHPDWSSQFCWDQDMSARSRRKLLEDCVESDALLCPAHFGGANAGYVKRQGDSFRIDWDR
jgi:glyoxylase-like metal-dependent hydrolase (beta-lactamase superfamily II)